MAIPAMFIAALFLLPRASEEGDDGGSRILKTP
jgi:hypothetical protein